VDEAAEHDEETTVVLNTLAYTGAGWRTTGDALLANAAAAAARERDRHARDAIREALIYDTYVSTRSLTTPQ
jgi:hypothetical protein